jgi:CIC family chloride channel protein
MPARRWRPGSVRGSGPSSGRRSVGAVLATEILYRDDFDVEALLPCFIASIVGYVIFGAAVGFTPLFGFNDSYHFSDPSHLLWFALIGVLGGFIGLLYAKGFYGIAAAFTRIPLPRWLKPAIGGVLVGSIALAIPEVLGTGYGWIQQSLGHQLLSLPLWVVLVLPFARIVATGLSIGSGGSGGIFGPGMVIGAFIGAAVWRLFDPIVPSMGHSPTPYVIVGMMCCFGSISRAPLAVMLMVAEMTGSVSILAPSHGRRRTGLVHRPARRRHHLSQPAEEPSRRPRPTAPGRDAPPGQRARQPGHGPTPPGGPGRHLVPAARRSDRKGRRSRCAGGRRRGSLRRSVSLDALNQLDEQGGSDHRCRRRRISTHGLRVSPPRRGARCAHHASQHWIPVLDNDRAVIGTIAMSDIVRGYRLGLLASLRQLDGTADAAGTHDIEIAARSSLVNMPLRRAGLPDGVIVTSIQRRRDLVIPDGDTVLQSGDRLVVIGGSEDIDALKAIASGSSPRVDSKRSLTPSPTVSA